MKIVLFDVDDTIYDRALPFYDAYESFFKKPIDDIARKAFLTTNARDQELFPASQKGLVTMREKAIHRYSKGFEDVGIVITPEQALEYDALYIEKQNLIRPTETMEKIIELFSQKAEVLGIITNGPGGHQRNKIKALGLYRWVSEGNVWISGEIGSVKPDSGIFLKAQRDLKAEPEDIWYVGDAYKTDIAGAAPLGWHTVWLNRKNAVLPDGGSIPDIVAESEEELLKIVEKLDWKV